MISLDLDPAQFPDVAEPHITVVFLGKGLSDGQLNSVGERVKEIAASRPPIKALVGGQGTFAPTSFSDNKIPVFAHVNAPGIDSLHDAFADVDASTFPTYQPHMTQTYVDEGEDIPEPLPQTPVTFTHLSIHKGDTVERYPFAGDMRSWAVFDAMRPKHPRVKKGKVEQSVATVESPHVPDLHGWKPSMTPAEADEWVKSTGSKITKALFHGTAPGKVGNILRGGFLKPSTKTTVNAKLYGEGTYLSASDRYSLRYSGNDERGIIETRVSVQHPASVSESSDIFKTVKGRNPSPDEYPGMVRAEAEKRGFDAIQVNDYFKPLVGPEQPVTNVIVFDPHKIVVVKR